MKIAATTLLMAGSAAAFTSSQAPKASVALHETKVRLPYRRIMYEKTFHIVFSTELHLRSTASYYYDNWVLEHFSYQLPQHEPHFLLSLSFCAHIC